MIVAPQLLSKVLTVTLRLFGVHFHNPEAVRDYNLEYTVLSNLDI